MQTIEQAIEGHNAIFIVGTGISAATAPGSPTATWVPLIKHGADRAEHLNPSLDPSWKPAVLKLLELGTRSDSAQALTSAASLVKCELQSHGPEAYARWLCESVGSIRVENTEVAEAVGSLPFPILTTNYDTLLESVLGRSSTEWRQASQMQQVIGGASSSIGHLHGVWTEPDSVVFSTEDYHSVLDSPAAQALQKAISSFKSIIYVGFGSGLGDPNFGQLLQWHRETFRVSGVTHFRLCRASEAADLERVHAGSNIVPVIYGQSHADLPSYLKDLVGPVASSDKTAAGIVRDVVQDARQALVETLAEDLILGESLSEARLEVGDLILPPILLPMPHAEFIKERRNGGTVDKIDALSELNETEFVVLAAESETGLTTALRWLAWKSSVDLGPAAPLCISFRECGKGASPLEKRVRAKALEVGLISRHSSEMPAYVLAIDDVNPSVGNIFDRVISSIARGGPVVTYIGCRQGDEDAILERLRQAGHSPRARYLSRLGDRDVARLIRRAHPAAAETLTDSVIDVLRGENLPRTPFSVSLLVQVLMQGGSIGSSASQTAILDEYVSMLLGRGDPHEDARFTIDQPGREALLANFAEHLARKGTAGVEEIDAIDFFDGAMKRYDWPDSAGAIIRHLVNLRVLRRNGSTVEFGRSSFLFLFAAKRAHTSTEFREFLLADALYYAPVVQDYSALVRSDLSALKAVLKTLPSDGDLPADRSPYEVLEPVEAPPAIRALGDDSEQGDEVPEAPDYLLGDHSDVDLAPFPVDATDNLSLPRRLMRSLALVSRVLRDSDQVEDLDLKSSAFLLTLERWGQLVSVLHHDPQIADAFSEIFYTSEQFAALREQDAAKFGEFVRAMSRVVPAAISGGGIEANLASRKLLRVFLRSLESGSLALSDERALAACLFAFALREQGWAIAVRRILAVRENFWLERNFLYVLFRDYYQRGQFSSEDDERALLESCVEMFDRATRYDSVADRVRRLDALREEMRHDRRLTLARAKVDGSSLSAGI